MDAGLPRQRRLRRPDRRMAGRELDRRAPPLERQAIQQRLADVATEIEAGSAAGSARSVDGSQRHADDRRPGLDVEAQGRRRRDVGDPDVHGPGRARRADADCPLEKWFRDAKIYQLFEGTAEIQRLVISRMQAAEYRERLAERRRDRGGGDGRAAPATGAAPNGEHPRPRSRRTAPTARRSPPPARPDSAGFGPLAIRPAGAKARRQSAPISGTEHRLVLGLPPNSPEMDGR